MPIANVVIRPNIQRQELRLEEVISHWANYSGQGHEYMTVNFISSEAQFGARYDAMAFLYLPTVWPKEKARDLQIGLAKAVAQVLDVEDANGVQIVTTMVPSGQVVEDGEVQTW